MTVGQGEGDQRRWSPIGSLIDLALFPPSLGQTQKVIDMPMHYQLAGCSRFDYVHLLVSVPTFRARRTGPREEGWHPTDASCTLPRCA
jgi:hypothetical protein